MTSVGSGSDVANAVALQKDGKIVVAGATTSAATGLDFAIVRYLDDGSPDTSFGDRGKTTIALSDDSDVAYALLIQDDGRIVAGGSANRGATTSGVDFALVRLEADGSLDESFGDRGHVLTPIGSNAASDVVRALVSQTVDGEARLIAAGGEGDFALARYTADGVLDPTFGDGGIVGGVFGSVIGAARAVSATQDGRIVIGGWTKGRARAGTSRSRATPPTARSIPASASMASSSRRLPRRVRTTWQARCFFSRTSASLRCAYC